MFLHSPLTLALVRILLRRFYIKQLEFFIIYVPICSSMMQKRRYYSDSKVAMAMAIPMKPPVP